MVQTFASRLYRFMRRAITKWPEQRSTAPLVSLYLAYIAPWYALQTSQSHEKGLKQNTDADCYQLPLVCPGVVPVTGEITCTMGSIHLEYTDGKFALTLTQILLGPYQAA